MAKETEPEDDEEREKRAEAWLESGDDEESEDLPALMRRWANLKIGVIPNLEAVNTNLTSQRRRLKALQEHSAILPKDERKKKRREIKESLEELFSTYEANSVELEAAYEELKWTKARVKELDGKEKLEVQGVDQLFVQYLMSRGASQKDCVKALGEVRDLVRLLVKARGETGDTESTEPIDGAKDTSNSEEQKEAKVASTDT